MVLVGVQPVLMQVPPRWAFSIMATVHPWSAREAAIGFPAWPLPIMIASYFMLISMGVLVRNVCLSRSLSRGHEPVRKADGNKIFRYGDEDVFHLETTDQ